MKLLDVFWLCLPDSRTVLFFKHSTGCGICPLQLVGKGVRCENSKANQKSIDRAKGHFVILLMGVVIKEGVASAFKFHQFAAIFFLRVSLCEFYDQLDRNQAITPAMVEHARGETRLRQVFGWTVALCLLIGSEFLPAHPLASGIDEGTEQKKGRRLEVLSGFVSDFWKGRAAKGEVGP